MNFEIIKNCMKSLTDWIIPGNAICVYYKGNKIFSYSSGYSDIESKKPFDTDDLINIYSCTKVSTVTAAAQLLERGFYTLDTPLYDIIPEFRDMYVKDKAGNVQKAKNHITIRHLFSMTAGFTYNLKSDGIKECFAKTNGRMPTLETVKHFAKDYLSFEPGTHWQYSLCHDCLAGVVEAVSGMKFSEYMKKNIFEPIGIKKVYYSRDGIKDIMVNQYKFVGKNTGDDLIKNQSTQTYENGYVVNNGKDVEFQLGSEYESGGAGLTTTVDEYAKFADCMANNGITASGERIISKGTIELMKINQLSGESLTDFNCAHYKGYGYGLGVRTLIDKSIGSSVSPLGEFGWCGAAGGAVIIDNTSGYSAFYAHHMLNPQGPHYFPRIRNALFASIDI